MSITAASRPPPPPPWPACPAASRNGWPRPSCATACAPGRPRPSSPPGAWRRIAPRARRSCAIPARPRPPLGAPIVSPLGPTARELQARFAETERALDELLHLDLTGFPDPDQRVLAACQRRLTAHVRQLAHTLQKEAPAHADPRGTDRTAAPAPRACLAPGHRPPPEPRREDDPPRLGSLPPGPAAGGASRPRNWRPTTP